MSSPKIGNIPAPPTLAAGDGFQDLAAAFVAAFPQLRTDVNAFGDYLDQAVISAGGPAPSLAALAVPVTDFDDAITGGIYSTTGSMDNGPNGTATYTGTLRVDERAFTGGARITQTFSESGTTPVIWTRVGTGDPVSWSSWVRALGEYGANSNGEYWRYPSGGQVCTRTIASVNTTTAAGSMYRSSPAVADFPAAFAAGSTPVGSGGATNTGLLIVGGRATSTSQWGYTTWSPTSRSGDTVQLMAVGRWK